MHDRAVAHPGTHQLVAVGAQGGQQRLQPVEGEKTQPPAVPFPPAAII